MFYMSDNTSIESRFEGHEIIEAGITPIPNLLGSHYSDLGLSDGQFALLYHVFARKWTKDAPYPSISGLPMSANKDTRRRYARDLRQKGLLFTSRLYWTKEDLEKNPHAYPGRVRSNLWFMGSLLHNLVRVHNWLKEKRPIEEFQIEIPLATVKMFLRGDFHDTPPEISQAIQEQTRNGEVLKAVLLPCENHTVEPSMRNSSSRKTSSRKTHSLKEESDSNKNQSVNKNQAAAAPAAANQSASEKAEVAPSPIQEITDQLEAVQTAKYYQEVGPPIQYPPAADPPPEDDPAFTQVCRLYQAEIGKMSPLIAGEIRDRLRRCPVGWFEQAISKAAAAEARRWNYIKSILAAWEKCGGPENDHRNRPEKNGVSANGQSTNRTTTIAGLRGSALDNPIKKRFNAKTGETYYFDVRTQQRVDPPG